MLGYDEKYFCLVILRQKQTNVSGDMVMKKDLGTTKKSYATDILACRGVFSTVQGGTNEISTCTHEYVFYST